MRLVPGTRLGPYEVLALIDAGGMGEVYRGRDTRLHRDVAIKVLPLREDVDGLASVRFDREARAIAALHHPNICAIYDVGREGDCQFFVMEFLDGETMQRRLVRGPLDMTALHDQALALADALDAAHSRGIIHRDLKPANVFITARGQVKILDFGLAKQMPLVEDVTHAADDQLTDPAVGVGTLAYMSPEQLRGVPLDARTDIFSLGLVLYEMATGRHAFSGATTALISAAILGSEPKSPREFRFELPVRLEEIILKALEKDRDLRYQSVAELRTDLKRLRRQSSDHARSPEPVAEPRATDPPGSAAGESLAAASPALPSPAAASSDAELLVGLVRRHPRAGTVLGVCLVGVVAGALWLSRHHGPASIVPGNPFPNLQIQPLTFTGDVSFGAISTDGRFVAYVRKNAGVWVRQIAANNEIQVAPFVEGRTYDSVTLTPDGSSVDFAVANGITRELWRVPLLGGTPRPIVSDIWSAPGWSPDGRRMAFFRTSGMGRETSIIVVREDGTHEQVLSTRRHPADFLNKSVGPWATNRPAWSPDGNRLAAIGMLETDSALVIVDASSGKETSVTPIKPGLVWEAAWLDDTHVLLNRNVSITAPPGLWSLDLAGGQLTAVAREFSLFHWIGLTADRRTGIATKTEMRGGLSVGNERGDNARPIQETISAMVLVAQGPAVDAEGGILYAAYADGDTAIFRIAPGGGKPVMVATGGGGGFTVSPNGRFVVYSSPPDAGLYRVNSDGSQRMKLVDRNAGGPVFTSDGLSVLFSPLGLPGLYSVPINGGPARQLSTLFVGKGPSISPDGKRVLFTSSKPEMAILCDLPDCTSVRELEVKDWRWAPDGKGVAYLNEQDHGNLWEQPLDGGRPRALTHFSDAQILDFAWSADYKRLVLSRGRILDDLVLLKGLQ